MENKEESILGAFAGADTEVGSGAGEAATVVVVVDVLALAKEVVRDGPVA